MRQWPGELKNFMVMPNHSYMKGPSNMPEATPPLNRRANPHSSVVNSPESRTALADLMRGLRAALLIFFCVSTARAADVATVSSLDLSRAEPLTLTITLSGEAQNVRAFPLSDPERLVLDIAPARLSGTKRSLSVEHPLVRGIRAAQFSPQSVRVVLDLKQGIGHSVATRPAAGSGSGQQVIVRVFPADPPPALSTGTAPPVGILQPEERSAQASASISATRPGDTAPNASNKKIILFDDSQASQNVTDSPSPWGTFALSGSVMVKGTQELHESGHPEQPRSLRNTVRTEGKWTPPISGQPQTGQSGTPDTFVLASVQSDYLGFGPDPSSDDYDLDLHEAYLSHATPTWDLRLGRQILRWGKTDQISPLDNLNPQDMREFVLPDLEERKIPDWMGRLRLFPGRVTLEGVFIPFAEENDFDFTGTTWALLGPESDGLRIHESEPGRGLDDAGWGLRAGTTVDGWDLAASFLHITEKNPHLSLSPFNPDGPVLHAEYRRQSILGLEFETTLGKFGFRGEAAYFDGQSLPTESLNSERPPVLHYVLGLDYIGEADWYANIQFSHQHVFEYEPDILFLREDNFYLNGEVNREFWRGQAMLKLRYAVDILDGGSFFTPEAILTYVKNLELSLGLNLFFGPQDSYFGRYEDNDQIFLQATYFF